MASVTVRLIYSWERSSCAVWMGGRMHLREGLDCAEKLQFLPSTGNLTQIPLLSIPLPKEYLEYNVAFFQVTPQEMA